MGWMVVFAAAAVVSSFRDGVDGVRGLVPLRHLRRPGNCGDPDRLLPGMYVLRTYCVSIIYHICVI